MRYAAHGDSDALEQLFHAIAPELLRVIARMAPTSTTPEELVQLTFLRALEIADRYRPDQPLIAWFVGIARRVDFQFIDNREQTLVVVVGFRDADAHFAGPFDRGH